jgi:hypothetical protein
MAKAKPAPTPTQAPPAADPLTAWAAETVAETKATLDELLDRLGSAPIPARAAVSVELEKMAARVATISRTLRTASPG